MAKNASLNLISVLFQECFGINRTLHTAPEGSSPTPGVISSEDRGAVMYIVVVLVFYSMGIVIMIIKYLKTERQELEEEAALVNFFKGMSMVRKANQEHNVNRVAIRAFHTLTTVNTESKLTLSQPGVVVTEV